MSWDVTVIDNTTKSYLSLSSQQGVLLLSSRLHARREICSDISIAHFVPIAFETMGPINQLGSEFIANLAGRTTRLTDDPRESTFLFQRLLVAIQRFNSVIFSHCFSPPSNFN